MKYLVIPLLALSLAQGCDKAPSQNGRFQILSTTYEDSDLSGKSGELKKQVSQKLGLFKLDTATGKVWRYNAYTFTSTDGVSSIGQWEDAEFTNKVKF